MSKKFIWSFLVVFFAMVFFKASVDLCLPFRDSAFFPQTWNRESFVCRNLYNWDERGRTERVRLASGVISPGSSLESKALDPGRVSLGDIALAWKVPLILPLIVEAVPRSGVASLKLLYFSIALALVLSGLWHYLGVLVQIHQMNARQVHMELNQDQQRFEKLLGRDR